MSNSMTEQYRAIARPIVTSYFSDVDVDCRIIEAALNPCLFFLRSTGTHAVQFPTIEQLPAPGQKVKYLFGYVGREHIVKQTELVDTLCNSSPLAVYFDGKRLKRVEFDKACQIARDYRARMFAQFDRERDRTAQYA